MYTIEYMDPTSFENGSFAIPRLFKGSSRDVIFQQKPMAS